jgi:hypothetical protein
MESYPRKLLPHPGFPLLKNTETAEYTFVRETNKNVYTILEKNGYDVQDILPFVVAPQPSLREVFELSVFLYGYYDEDCVGMRLEDKSLYAEWDGKPAPLNISFSREPAWPLFMAAAKMNGQEIDFNGVRHVLSFSHKPTRANYWHFELWVEDDSGRRIPRDKSSAHTKYLALSILEYIVSEAICLPESVLRFKRADFDTVLEYER